MNYSIYLKLIIERKRETDESCVRELPATVCLSLQKNEAVSLVTSKTAILPLVADE